MSREILGLFLSMLACQTAEPAPPFEPTSAYESRQVEGWTVLIHKAFLAREPELAARTLEHLEFQFHEIIHKLPEKMVTKLKQVKIWVEASEPHHPCMAYHPDPGWLREHGMNPGKARCVEIANAKNFLKWTREQPWMVLHELAHAYHHQFLPDGFENEQVRKAFREASREDLYAEVLHYDGKDIAAYAKTNPMEYFAESTEAFFGTNDFYPFVRAELRKHDPRIHDLLKELWEAR